MTQEERNQLYGENTWGIYIFRIDRKNVLQELLNLNERYPDTTMLNVYTNRGNLADSRYMFDMTEANIYLYYYERDDKLYEEIQANLKLNKGWTDSDSFDLDYEQVEELRKNKSKVRYVLLQLMRLNDDFINLLLERENKEED